MEHDDWLRALMITEPRGYPCQNLDIIYPATPNCPEAAFSYVIAENHPCYPAMSGHNTICVATALLETGMVQMQEPITSFVLEAPAGPIRITAQCEQGKAKKITLRNAPAFVRPEDMELTIKVPKGDVGAVTVSVAYGGMWYAIVDAASVGLKIQLEDAAELVRIGEMIKIATMEQHPVEHPTVQSPGWNTAMRGDASHGGTAANAVVMSTGTLDWEKPASWTGNLDRSPCGTGTSAVMALLYAQGKLGLNEEFHHEGILGTIFTGKLVEEIVLKSENGEDIKAVVPEITGEAWVTQYSQVVVDPTDPFGCGYRVGDIWSGGKVTPNNHTNMANF